MALPKNQKEYAEEMEGWLDYCRGKDLSQSEEILNKLLTYGEQLLPLLTQSCFDEDDDIRFKSAILFGQLRDSRTTESLLKMLDDSREGVALAAARALGHLEEPWAGVRLLDLCLGVRRHPSVRVRVEAACSAARLGFPQAFPFLLTIMKENTRLAEPVRKVKDWDWTNRWAWEKGMASEVLIEASGRETDFDVNQGIEDMERSIQSWIDWWESRDARSIPSNIRNDLRFRQIEESMKKVSDEFPESPAGQSAAFLMSLLSLDSE